MERRDFLKAGALAGGSVGLGAVGCGAVLEGLSAVPVPSPAELQALGMDDFLKSLDSSLGFIQSTGTLDTLVPREQQLRAKREDPRFEHTEEVVRKTFRTLLLADSFNALPEAGRVHPGMQARMLSSMQEMDDAVYGMNNLLTSFSPTERSDISRLMRDDATLGPRILGSIDDEAVKAGVPQRRRDHLLEVGKHVCFRMRQSTPALIDEYDSKLQKVSARDASLESVQRRLMAQMGEKAFWEYHQRQFALAQAWQNVPGIAQGAPPPGTGVGPAPGLPPPPGSATATATAAAATAAGAWSVGAPSASAPVGSAYPSPLSTGSYVVYPFPPPAPPRSSRAAPEEPVDEEGRKIKYLKKGNTLLTVGGILLGLGAIAGVIGGLIIGGGEGIGGAFVITAAVALGLSGIGCLIAGGVYRGRA